jgi:histidine ammonia-lyase
MDLTFTTAPLRLDPLAPVFAGERVRLRLAPALRRRIDAGRRVVERVLKEGRTVYGVNTGFGKLSNVRIGDGELGLLQVNLLRSHACGVGRPLPTATVRALLVLRVRALATGRSGVRPELVAKLIELLDADVIPVVPSQGSVGASGDLAPLAHLALALIGEGEVEHAGKRMPAAKALAAASITPIALAAKEGLSLINGTQVTTALTAEALLRAENVARHADVACALTIEALKGTNRAFDKRIQEARPHPGQRVAAANLHGLIEGSAILASHKDCDRVQDPYSMRCAPQVHGACRDQLAEARRVVEIEIDAATDNPLVFAEEGEILSGGNFHAQPVAAAADRIAAAVTDLASICERRVENLVNPDLNFGLPAFLTPKPGLRSGLMIAQVVAAALVSECKSLSFPASVDSIPTSANKEDHVSMGPIAARKALQIVENAERVVGIELLAAAQALDFETKLKTTKPLRAAHAALRERVAKLDDDRILAPDLEAAAELVRTGALVAAARKAGAKIH